MAAASKYTPTVPSIPWSDAGKSDGATVATALKTNAVAVPSAINVNMLRLRRATEAAPRSRNGQPAQTTTGVARTSSSHWMVRADSTSASGRPGRTSDIPSARTTAVGAIDQRRRRVMSTSSGLGASSSATMRGSSAMPQIGQAPGPSRTTSGCIGQV